MHSAAVGAYGQVTIDRGTVGSIAVQAGRGVRVVDIVSGREPKRANELAAEMAKPLLLQTEFEAVRERMSRPPAFPSEDSLFDDTD